MVHWGQLDSHTNEINDRRDTDNVEAMSEALNAIATEAEKLLTLDLPEDVERRLERIEALARYKFTVTNVDGASN